MVNNNRIKQQDHWWQQDYYLSQVNCISSRQDGIIKIQPWRLYYDEWQVVVVNCHTGEEEWCSKGEKNHQEWEEKMIGSGFKGWKNANGSTL